MKWEVKWHPNALENSKFQLSYLFLHPHTNVGLKTAMYAFLRTCHSMVTV